MDIVDAGNKLSRNPLGIIALFIVLVYGIAALVFGLRGRELESNLKAPLVYFLVSFPVLVLIVFAWLVSKHHTKLYSPSDYRADESFLRTIDLRELNRRLDEETELVASVGEPVVEGDSKVVPDKLTLARRSDLRESIVLAEDLVFRDLELEFSAPIRRHVQLTTRSGEVRLDGVILRQREPVGVEVKFFRKSLGLGSRDHLVELARRVQGMSLLVALVSDRIPGAERERNAQRVRAEMGGDNVEVRTYDFAELRTRFGIDRPADKDAGGAA